MATTRQSRGTKSKCPLKGYSNHNDALEEAERKRKRHAEVKVFKCKVCGLYHCS